MRTAIHSCWSRWRLLAACCGWACAAVSGAGGGADGAQLPDTSAEKAYSYLEVIAGKIGERAAGSDAEGRSVDYIAGQFKSWGLETTVLPVKVPVWRERRARLWAEGGTGVE